MYELALFHAAARGNAVITRTTEATNIVRRGSDEENMAFLRRLRQVGEPITDELAMTQPIFAALLNGDVTLPEDSLVYATIPGTLAGSVSASDLCR